MEVMSQVKYLMEHHNRLPRDAEKVAEVGAGFDGKGGVVVASCYWKKCEEMRHAVEARGHSCCVCFYPDDKMLFGFEFGENIEKFAKNASRVFVIIGDDDE